jgi:hypothetical protein
VYCVSASDRYNYGDLLFPLVAKWHLTQCGACTFINVAIVNSDLSAVGALPTIGYDVFLDETQQATNTTILIAGGQVLNSDWLKLLSFIKPRWFDMLKRYDHKRLKRHLFYRFKLFKEPLPFMPSQDNLLENNKVMYHAVGGSVPKLASKKQVFAKALKKAVYVSVRDRASQRMLRGEVNQASRMLPDSVITYSDIKPKNSLTKQTEEPYVCVQFGYQKSKNKLPIVLKELEKIYDEFGFKIGLLSIGNCPGHDDIIAAKWLASKARFPVFHLSHNHIDDITSALAHAELFIGTSLHGAILSMTYSNPFVAVDKRINKLNAYTKSWAPDYLQGCVAYKEIARAASVRMKQHTDYSEIIEKQKALVRASFKEIYALSK